MKDQELFDLCKQVYEALAWRETHQILVVTNQGITTWHNNGEFEVGNMGAAYPLYTSDYLLDKLPKKNIMLSFDEISRTWRTIYGADIFATERIRGNADTPLKALLKLCLALHKEGLLS